MPQVSKRPLNAEIKEKMLNTFFDSIVMAGDKTTVQDFLDDLLPPTEKLMLAKRLTAAYFIEKRLGYRRISDILKLSPTTINNIQKILLKEGRGYKAIFRLISKTSKLENFMDKLAQITESSMPPIKGSKSSYHRWKK